MASEPGSLGIRRRLVGQPAKPQILDQISHAGATLSRLTKEQGIKVGCKGDM
jgi:hypothetical protein